MNCQTLSADAAGAYPAPPRKVRTEVRREARVRYARCPPPEDLAPWVMRTLALGLLLFVLVLLLLHG